MNSLFNIETLRRLPLATSKTFAWPECCAYATLLCYAFGIAFVASAAIFEELPLSRRISHRRARLPPFSLNLYHRSFELGYCLPHSACIVV